jgi:tRNA pseudouridine55 synthase
VASRRDTDGPHGILIVDKPSGPTSHDIVAQARRHFKTRRVGHAGTLDPMATGELVLLFGEATKLCDVASGCDKRYLAEVRFGRATDSHDADGATTEERAETPGWIGESALELALARERARELQVPPAISALKVGGQRAYRLSRAGTPPELEPRFVRVHSLELVRWNGCHLRLELLVSKGYYVRGLARDLSSTLGVPGHLGELRRLQSGNFDLDGACPWPPPVDRFPVPLATALPRLLPTLRLKSSGIARARQGQTLSADDFLDAPGDARRDISGGARRDISGGTADGGAGERRDVWGWTDAAGVPVALGERQAEGFRVRRGFSADLEPGTKDQTVAISVS